MSSKGELTEEQEVMLSIYNFFEKEHEELILYTMNKQGVAPKGKNPIILEREEEAEVILENVMMYFLGNTELFDKQWVYNTIMQRRVNFIRDRDREEAALSSLKTLPTQNETKVFDTDKERVAKLIRKDINLIEDPLIKEVVSRYYIKGESIQDIVNSCKGSNDKMIYKWLSITTEKYSSIYSEDD